MRTICLYFQVHQPFRFKRYRFFEIGNEHYYYDDYLNESIIRKVADKCYLPANKVLLDLIKEFGTNFKVAFSLSGSAIDQFELYAPDVIQSFQKLAKTGCVEFLGETYSHSLVSLRDDELFREQVEQHRNKIKQLFGQSPVVFRNTELVYSDEIGAKVAGMGFKAMVTEGAKHVLGWKSPNYLYCNAINPKLKILLRNFKLSDDIAFRFSNSSWNEYPLTSEKYAGWLKSLDTKEDTVNIFVDYETFGEHQWADTGIFEFLKALPKAVFKGTDFAFGTPSEIADKFQPVSAIHVPYPISWADEERDLTAWLGNELQNEAFNKFYGLSEKVKHCKDAAIHQDWKYLQASDHFYYMSTKFFSDGKVHAYFNPYETPYDAFINYMNILSDFAIRIEACAPQEAQSFEIARLSQVIAEKEQLIRKYEKQLQIAGDGPQAKKTTAKSEPKSAKTVKTGKKVNAEKPATPKQTSTPAKPKTTKPAKPAKTVAAKSTKVTKVAAAKKGR